MGILARPAKLVEALPLAPGFTVCELGNQTTRTNGVRPAREWYEKLGCGRYVSIDANGAATHFADLNYPLSKEMDLGQFDIVTDFGTGEHIFNQAQVWTTLHDLTKVGGLIIFDRPQTGWAEHCFYNVHTTLIADIAATNGYNVAYLETHRIDGHGDLLFGVLQKLHAAPFKYPNQGKYREMLKAGNTKPAKRWTILEQIVKEHGWRHGAEIGVLNGATFFHLLDTCPDLSMVAVDQWAQEDAVYGDLTDVGQEFIRRALSYPHRAFVLYGPSAGVAKHIPDGSLDFCFIDASHDYDSALADIKAWSPKVRPGGAVMGHDIDYPEVAKAVEEVFGVYETLSDDVWMVRC